MTTAKRPARNPAAAKSAAAVAVKPVAGEATDATAAATATKPAVKRVTAKTTKAAPKIRSAREVYMQAIVDEHQNKKSSRLLFLPESTTIQLGIRIPLVLEYLIASSVLPLGIVVEANGPPMACKTALMYEFGRIFKEAGGWLEMILTEGKISKSLARSVIGYDEESQQAITPWRADDLTEMMTITHDRLDEADKFIETKHPDTGKRVGDVFPLLVGIDSIMGSLMQDTMKKMAEAGGKAERQYPIEALLLTPFMKMIASRIQRYPYLVFLINHRKEAKPDPQRPYEKPEFTKPGGKQLQFSQTYELVLRMVSQGKEVDTSEGGSLEVHHRLIRIENGKNSGGTNGRQADVKVSWHHRVIKNIDDKDELVQITKWHWDEALVDLLMQWKDGKVKGFKTKAATASAYQKRLDEFVHLRRETGGRYWSRDLGMTAQDATSAAKLGKMLGEDERIRDRIRLAFGIQRGEIWEPGTSYSSAKRKVERKSVLNGKHVISKYGQELAKAYENDSEEE